MSIQLRPEAVLVLPLENERRIERYQTNSYLRTGCDECGNCYKYPLHNLFELLVCPDLITLSPPCRTSVRSWRQQNLKNLQRFWTSTSKAGSVYLHLTISCWLCNGSTFLCIQMRNKSCLFTKPRCSLGGDSNQFLFFCCCFF